MNQLALLLVAYAAMAHGGMVRMWSRRVGGSLEEPNAGQAEEVSKGPDVHWVQPYTDELNHVDSAGSMLKSHLYRQEVSNPNDPYVQYLMIVYAVDQLIEASMTRSYTAVYYEVVNQAILETVRNPKKVADTIRARLDKTGSKLAVIRDIITRKQQDECSVPISYTCNLIIDIYLDTLNDDLAKAQAHYLLTVSNKSEMFLDEYSSVFEVKAKHGAAEAYLVNGISELKPLVMAGVDARKEGGNVPPLGPFRRFGGADEE